MAHNGVACSLDEFIDAFFPPVPPDTAGKPDVKRNPFSKLANATNMAEGEISQAFTRAVTAEKLVPGYGIALSERKPDARAVDPKYQRIDSALFQEKEVPTNGRPNWADQIVAIEFKNSKTENDPFQDTDDDVLPATANTRAKVRGQLITYAELAFAVQQRTALFMFLIMGRRFRLLRWDRSGCIVTQAVDYVSNWKKMCDILWRISRLTRDQLGFDSTATRLYPHDEEWKLMTQASTERTTDWNHAECTLPEGEIPKDITFAYVRAKFKASLVDEWPRYKISVPDGEGRPPRYFLVGKPSFMAPGVAGRATQGFVALDPNTGTFSWMKNAWRAAYLDVDKEGDTLHKLAGVPHVPTLVCHGDIEGHRTITADWWTRKHSKQDEPAGLSVPTTTTSGMPIASTSRVTLDRTTSSGMKRKRGTVEEDTPEPQTKPRKRCPLRLHQHYRLVVAEVAMPLHHITGGKQLLSIVYDCLTAHYIAMDQKHIIHRDVSGGNILILPKVIPSTTGDKFYVRWTGLLADWEMSKPTLDKRKTKLSRQPERTGTWQFMSAGLLTQGSKTVSTVDELEAFLYVILYYAIRYLRSNCRDVPNFIEDLFDSYTFVNGQYSCGNKKSDLMNGSGEPELLIKDSKDQLVHLRFHSPLDGVLLSMLRRFNAHYRVTRVAKQRKAASDLREALSKLQLPQVASKEGYEPDEPFRSLPPNVDRAAAGDDVMLLKKKTRQLVTEEDHELARSVQSHQMMLIVLYDAMRTMEWPDDDHVGDRVPDDWVPKRPVGPVGKSRVTCDITADDIDEALEHIIKRRKTEEHEEGEPTFASLPIHPSAQKPPQTPSRRTRKAKQVNFAWQQMDDRQLKKEGLRDWFLGKTMALLPNWLTGKKA